MKRAIKLSLCILLILLIGGCASYTKHSKKFNDTVGKWSLSCIYVDTKPQPFNQQILEIKKNKTGSVTENITVTPATVNPDGTPVPAVTENQVKDLKIDAKTGEITITMAEVSVVYTFTVDKPAGILHLYTTVNEQTVHYIYDIVK